jgi:UDP-2,3-diacylglucosamine hydrolase
MGHDPSLWADVDPTAAGHWLTKARAQRLIHGHTHRPGHHTWTQGQTFEREVLSDWELGGSAPRSEVLRLNVSGKLTRWQPQAA